MLKTNYLQLTLLLVLISVFSASAQVSTKKQLEEEAYNALNNEDYTKAYEKFDRLNSKYPTEFDYKVQLGICCLKVPEKKERALIIFTEIKNEVPDFFGANYFLGKAYHANYKFEEAITTLQQFISELSSSTKKEDKVMIDEANMLITNSNNGKVLLENKIAAEVRNIGSPINTEEEQYVPVITTDESMLVFTYSGKFSVGGKLNSNLEPDSINGRYNEDVYVSYTRPDQQFSDPISVDAINTKGSDAAIAISADGQTLFTFYSDEKNYGDIQISKLIGENFSKPTFLNKNINSEYWEGSCSISADGRYLYFASERPGGIGGRDIWVSEKINGDWDVAKNMGSSINTPYDDDDPFIHPDGITLFFSSKGHSSIGGYDIMFSLKQNNVWLPPQNMGYPLNSTEDDRFYVINSKGDRGYFSSDRWGSDAKGKNDIYMVQPGILVKKPVIALLKGTIYGDDKLIEAKVEIIRDIKKDQLSKEEIEFLSNNEISPDGKLVIGTYFSNSTTGKYLTTLAPGALYKLKVSAENYESIEEDLDLGQLSEYIEISKDFRLISAENATAKKIVPVDTSKSTPEVTSNTALPCNDQPAPDFSFLKGKSLNDINYYNQLLTMAGNYCASNLIFKVQVGAYRKPENFNYKHLQSFGTVESNKYEDGITRFTQLDFKTLNDAELHRQKVIAKGQKDAWLVAFIDGKRYSLEDLILLDFLGKTIN